MIRGGRSYVTSPPSFSNDTKKLLVCTGNTVSVFSAATGLQITSLEGHTAPVTTLIVVPASSVAQKILCYCWTASLDGTIRQWDFSGPELLKTIDAQLPIYSMVIPSLLSEPQQVDKRYDSSKLVAYVSVEDTSLVKEGSKELRGHIRRFNLAKERLPRGETLKETEEPKSIVISPSGEYFGIRHKCKIHVWDVPSGRSKDAVSKKMTLHHTKVISAFAFHPTERIIAAGDVTGRLLIWRGFGNRKLALGNQKKNGRAVVDVDNPGVRGEDDAESCTTWHWHSAEVNVINFSCDGAYLYSGGREGVLVVWQLDTGKKKFLPRIGSPLLYFMWSPDPTLSSVVCADNQIHLLKMPSMEIYRTISGIKPPPSLPKMYEGLASTVAFDRSSGIAALCTENYCVQLYNLLNDRGISEVQVCERNHQPGDEVTVVVTAVALSLDGSVMSTTEVKLPEDGIGGLVSLKFWESEPDNKTFTLSTIVYDPHRDAGVSAIAFHPTRSMAVSTSFGGDFKIWVCNSDKNSSWICHAVGSYKKKPMTAAAFSGDGTVLAVAAENVITLWNPDKNILLSVLGATLTPITKLCFAGKSEFLVAASHFPKPELSVWDTSKLSLSWSYGLRIEAVTSAVDSSAFAVLALIPDSFRKGKSKKKILRGRDGAILLFNGSDPKPVSIWTVMKAEGGSISFLEGDKSQLRLAYVNGSHEYVVFDPNSDESHERSAIDYEGLAGHEETTGDFGYTSLYGQLPDYDKKRMQDSESLATPFVSSERPWETIFSGSTLNFPPLPKLCAEFFESLMEKRTAVVE
uniref:WD repeat-containing protein 75 n=1 Tax=Noccaea caerulescens TaxID=107243 RepID=A0A1J3IIZ1_NOCCA